MPPIARAILILLVLTGWGSSLRAEEPLTVFAAASLKTALDAANQLHRLQSDFGHDAPRMISTGWTRVALRAGK